MTTAYTTLQSTLRHTPKIWLITGAAGFIGSHLAEALLNLDQRVIGLDNLSTGFLKNIDQVRTAVGPAGAERFRFIEGDITHLPDCQAAVAGVDYVLHQAALGSVPRSIKQPLDTHFANVTGFANMAVAAQTAGVKNFVYASSSSVYGDHPALPKVEKNTGRALSPYAASKATNETYATAYTAVYDFHMVGLRYFNVMGARQNPAGAYAAVIPRWMQEFIEGKTPTIFGDGETSRDFCPIANVVQANLLAASRAKDCRGEVYNVAIGGRTTLNTLFDLLRDGLAARGVDCAGLRPNYTDFRAGDVTHSHANIDKAITDFGYAPTHSLADGLERALDWYLESMSAS
jgi:UDP-N-acetylglucosamine 4-epimerase